MPSVTNTRGKEYEVVMECNGDPPHTRRGKAIEIAKKEYKGKKFRFDKVEERKDGKLYFTLYQI